jgi:hypothetical protein
LILVAPRYSVVIYLDSGSEAKIKNYAYIKGVLDDALEGYARKGCDFRAGAENVKDGRHMFKHVIKFSCIKQPPNSVKEAFYVLELCPRGNNKDVIIIILVHDNGYIPC